MKRHATTVLLALLTALFLAPATVSIAHHKSDHDQGPGSSAQSGADSTPASDVDPATPEGATSAGPGADSGSTGNDGADEQKSKSGASGKSKSTGSGKSSTSQGSGKSKSDSGAGHGAQPACTNDHEGNFSGNGANDHGSYDSTCDGRPSENGNGSGGGRPCMGCVGNADNKNPPGQYPDGSDHNNGYECDGNNGVGKGNPAHTDCQPPPPLPLCVPSVENNYCQPPPPPKCVPSVENSFCTTPPPPPKCVPSVENSFCLPSPPPEEVLGEVLTRPGDGDSVQGGLLAFTGADVRGLLALGLIMAIAGLSSRIAGRRASNRVG